MNKTKKELGMLCLLIDWLNEEVLKNWLAQDSYIVPVFASNTGLVVIKTGIVAIKTELVAIETGLVEIKTGLKSRSCSQCQEKINHPEDRRALACELVVDKVRSQKEVSEDLGIPKSTLSDLIRKYRATNQSKKSARGGIRNVILTNEI